MDSLRSRDEAVGLQDCDCVQDDEARFDSEDHWGRQTVVEVEERDQEMKHFHWDDLEKHHVCGSTGEVEQGSEGSKYCRAVAVEDRNMVH